jgi:hypothetical protein
MRRCEWHGHRPASIDFPPQNFAGSTEDEAASPQDYSFDDIWLAGFSARTNIFVFRVFRGFDSLVGCSISGFVGFVLHVAPSVLNFSFRLFHCSIGLFLGASGPLTDLALNASGNVFSLTFNFILVHDNPPEGIFGISGGAKLRAVRGLNWATTLNQPDQNCNYCQDEQNVDEPSQRVRTDHAKQPEDQEHYSNRPKHRNFLSSKFCEQLFSSLGGGERGQYPVKALSREQSRFIQDGIATGRMASKSERFRSAQHKE